MLGVDQIASFPLAPGVAGTQQTLARMAAMVRQDCQDPEIRKFAVDLCYDIPGHDFHSEIQRLFRFVRDDIVYRKDPQGVEWVQDTKRTLFVFQSGDCDCKIECLATLLASLGHRPRFKVIGRTSHKYRHIYLEVQSVGQDGILRWVPLDPTPEHAPAGWEAEGQAAVFEIFPDADSGGGSPKCLLGIGLILYSVWKLMGK